MNTDNWGTFVLKDLFKVISGNGFDLNKMTQDNMISERVAFVTRSGKNNGVGGFVDIIDGEEPFPAGSMSIALGGSLGSTFVHDVPFYTGEHQVVLIPLQDMTIEQKLFIATVIYFEANTNYTPFGRELDRYVRTTFKIKLPVTSDGKPDFESMTSYIRNLSNLKSYYPSETSSLTDVVTSLKNKIKNDGSVSFDCNTWKKYKVSDLFHIKKGKHLASEDKFEGDVPFISSVDSNNGISDFISIEPISDGNVITVNFNGSVGETFYQPVPFWASGDVNILEPKEWKMNEAIGLFLCAIFRMEKYRFSYGRKWNAQRMASSEIMLPATPDGKPDWKFMEKYINTIKH